MQAQREPPRKTISATFRIDSRIHDAMQEDSRTRKISVNTLVNQLLDIYFTATGS
jgi:predicted HicB family RNase H-like nuclease